MQEGIVFCLNHEYTRITQISRIIDLVISLRKGAYQKKFYKFLQIMHPFPKKFCLNLLSHVISCS